MVEYILKQDAGSTRAYSIFRIESKPSCFDSFLVLWEISKYFVTLDGRNRKDKDDNFDCVVINSSACFLELLKDTKKSNPLGYKNKPLAVLGMLLIVCKCKF